MPMSSSTPPYAYPRPSLAAGTPNWLSSDAMRMSAFIAVSSPPPMQYPRIIAMMGLSTVRHDPHAAASASS